MASRGLSSNFRSQALAAASVLGIMACGGAATSEAPAATAGTDRQAWYEDRWPSLTWEEKHDVMTFTVLPNMARLFQRFRGSKDPDLTCASCHGRDAEAVAYKMPHGLSALDPMNMPSDEGNSPEARMVRFMREDVTPEMASLIGSPGVGCLRCHPSKASER